MTLERRPTSYALRVGVSVPLLAVDTWVLFQLAVFWLPYSNVEATSYVVTIGLHLLAVAILTIAGLALWRWNHRLLALTGTLLTASGMTGVTLGVFAVAWLFPGYESSLKPSERADFVSGAAVGLVCLLTVTALSARYGVRRWRNAG